MRLAITAVVFLTTGFCGFSALATSVVPETGEVSINRGDGFKAVLGASQAKSGDTVIVSPDGSARVVYNGQCSVPVKPGSVVRITSEPPCKNTASFDPYGTRMNAGITPGKGFVEPPPTYDLGWLPFVAVGIPVVLCVSDVICDDDSVSRNGRRSHGPQHDVYSLKEVD